MEIGNERIGEINMRLYTVYFKKLIKLMLSSSVSIFILCCFCYIYDYSGVHITNETGATDYKWKPNQWRATMKEGFAWFRMDEFGFNNVSEKALRDHNTPDILLMGSSHMEAISIDASENTGNLLNKLLPELTTYNIGTSGHTIIHCVDNINDALNQYAPSNYVILETSNIYLDEDEMRKVINKNHVKIPSYDSGILYILQTRIPAVKVLYKSIQDWRGSSAEDPEKSASKVSNPIFSADYYDTLSEFLYISSRAVSDSGAKFIIFYHPESRIDESGQIINSTDPKALEFFQSACEEQGIIFVDMTEPFNKLYEEEHFLAHGFVNSGVGAGHLNKHGHRVIAETLSDVIKADMEGENNVTQ